MVFQLYISFAKFFTLHYITLNMEASTASVAVNPGLHGFGDIT